MPPPTHTQYTNIDNVQAALDMQNEIIEQLLNRVSVIGRIIVSSCWGNKSQSLVPGVALWGDWLASAAELSEVWREQTQTVSWLQSG